MHRVSGVGPPAVVFGGRTWFSDELAQMAGGWLGVIGDAGTAPGAPRGLVLSNDPLAVALLFALSALADPVIVLPPEPEGWRCTPPIPSGTPVVLLPTQRGLASAAESLGLRPMVLPAEVPTGPPVASAGFMRCPGFVLLTSGSTGSPKPVFRRVARVLGAVAARGTALGLVPGEGVITAQPLSHGQGFTCLLTAAWLGSPFALLPHFHPTPVLALFASGDSQYWVGSVAAADVLRRAPGAARLPAPRICLTPGHAAPSLPGAFRERFGVPLRQNYSTTETGSVTVDGAPAADVRWDTVGRPIPGVEVRIAEDPRAPLPAGSPGRIWIRTSWHMDGYGVPPRVEAPPEVEGWWPTKDLGHLDGTGRLVLRGRLDDCVRTRAGHVVDLAEIAGVLRGFPGVTDAAVVPLDGETGISIGAVVEADAAVTLDEIRAGLAQALPPWAHPRLLERVAELPRLAPGKPDRRACIAFLERRA